MAAATTTVRRELIFFAFSAFGKIRKHASYTELQLTGRLYENLREPAMQYFRDVLVKTHILATVDYPKSSTSSIEIWEVKKFYFILI